MLSLHYFIWKMKFLILAQVSRIQMVSEMYDQQVTSDRTRWGRSPSTWFSVAAQFSRKPPSLNPRIRLNEHNCGFYTFRPQPESGTSAFHDASTQHYKDDLFVIPGVFLDTFTTWTWINTTFILQSFHPDLWPGLFSLCWSQSAMLPFYNSLWGHT